MKARTVTAIIIFLIMTFVFCSTSNAGTLYGLVGLEADPSSQAKLIEIDTNTGIDTLICSELGDISDAGLAYNPLNGLLYCVSGNADDPDLLTINPSTCEINTIGGLAHGYGGGDPGLAFDPCTETLYLSKQGTPGLFFTIDISTGKATEVGPIGMKIGNSGLAFDPQSRILYGVSIYDFFTINFCTGLSDLYPDPIAPMFVGATFDPVSEILFATAIDQVLISTTLYVIDPVSGITTSSPNPLGFNNVEGLAYSYNMEDITCPLLDPPEADAGPNQEVKNNVVNLDGSGSYDPDGTIKSYEWSLKYRIFNFKIPSNNKTAIGETPTVTGLSKGYYDVTLTVTDCDGLTDKDTMVVTSCFISSLGL